MGIMMTPLIDGDILLHEIGWSCEFSDKETGERILFDADKAEELLKKKIEIICEDVQATYPPIIFLTDNEWLAKKQKREFVKGFRYSVAVTKPYKGNRVNPKPFHFYNILSILLSDYKTIVSTNGLEADDVLCQFQYAHNPNTPTIICSRDKDVRICPGLHYSWECGEQRSIGPVNTDSTGWLEKKSNGDVLGYGLAFFYYQMLVGDSADHIPGLPKFGKAKAFDLLDGDLSSKERDIIVKNLYKEVMGDKAKEYFKEQADLLWMRFAERKDLI